MKGGKGGLLWWKIEEQKTGQKVTDNRKGQARTRTEQKKTPS